MKKVEYFFEKYSLIFKTLFIIILVSIIIKSWLRISIKNDFETKRNWVIEDSLHFTGVIEEYNGRGFKSSPTVFTIDNIIYQVPRSNIDMGLNKGDTISKKSGEHKYLIKRNIFFKNNFQKKIDTIEFFK